MSTPFAAFANAVIVFQRQTAPPTIDALGNPTAETIDFVLTAYVKGAGSTAGTGSKEFPGGQDNAIAIEGRCVSPLALPPDIVPGVAAEALIAGIPGEFHLEATIPSAFGTDSLLGAKLKGKFITRTLLGSTV